MGRNCALARMVTHTFERGNFLHTTKEEVIHQNAAIP